MNSESSDSKWEITERNGFSLYKGIKRQLWGFQTTEGHIFLMNVRWKDLHICIYIYKGYIYV